MWVGRGLPDSVRFRRTYKYTTHVQLFTYTGPDQSFDYRSTRIAGAVLQYITLRRPSGKYLWDKLIQTG